MIHRIVQFALGQRFLVLMITGLIAISRQPNTAWMLLWATIGGIGFNGLLTLATWALFTQFLKVKARGRVTDEMLHYSFCWLVLATLLPLMALQGWNGMAPAMMTFANSETANSVLLT